MKIGVLFLKLLLNGGLLYIVAADSVENTQIYKRKTISYYLPNYVVPLHYDIKLSLYDTNEISTMQGESNITIDVRRATSKISLHVLQITLTDVILINRTGTNFKSLGYSYDSDSNIIIFDFDYMIPQGFYTLYIKYISYLLENEKNSVFKMSYVNEQNKKILQIATFSQPCWARRLFPCWDEPAFEAIFNISIRHRAQYSAVSNSLVQKLQTDENGMIWTHFHKTIPTPTYRLTLMIVMSNMVHITNTNETIYIWCNPKLLSEVTFAFNIAEQIKNKLNWYSRSSCKMRKMDLITITDFSDKSIGNWGVTLHREAHILHNKDYDDIMKKMEIARLVARTTAYQWLDNVLTPSWWSDLWLNEGLAILFQVHALNKTFPEWRIPDLFVVQTQHESLHLDAGYNMMPLAYEVKSLSEINSLLSLQFYVKAPAIIRMVQHIVTNVRLNPDAMYEYFNVNQFKGMTSVDFWTAMQNALHTSSGSNMNNNFKLSFVMDTWTMQQLYPILRVTRNYVNGQVKVTQENINMINKNKWWIPLTYTAQRKPNFLNTLPRVWLKPQSRDLTLNELYEKDEWIIFNLQQTGYYRVNYDIDNWALIARFLNEKDYTKIHVLNRAQIIDDAYHFMIRKQIPFTLFLQLTNYLSRETDYIAWYPMIKALENLSSYLPYKETETLQKHVQKILNTLLLKIGYDEKHNENDLIKCLRQEAAKWACTFNDVNCKNNAQEKVLMHLENPKSLKPGWRFWAYCNGLRISEDYVWDYEIPFESGSRKLIDLFHCPGVSIIDHHIHALNMNKIIKSNSPIITTFIYSIVSSAKINLKKTLELIKYYNTRFITKTLTAVINNVYAEAELNEINMFVQDYLQEKKEMQETVANIQNKIKKRLLQIKKQLKKLSMWNTMDISN